MTVKPPPAPLKVAISPAPGTKAGSVAQLVLVDHVPSVEPSQMSLVARTLVQKTIETSPNRPTRRKFLGLMGF